MSKLCSTFAVSQTKTRRPYELEEMIDNGIRTKAFRHLLYFNVTIYPFEKQCALLQSKMVRVTLYTSLSAR